jgi:hypothetical protein
VKAPVDCNNILFLGANMNFPNISWYSPFSYFTMGRDTPDIRLFATMPGCSCEDEKMMMMLQQCNNSCRKCHSSNSEPSSYRHQQKNRENLGTGNVSKKHVIFPEETNQSAGQGMADTALDPSSPHKELQVQQDQAKPPGRPFLPRLNSSHGRKKKGAGVVTEAADAIASEFARPDP